MWFNVNDIILRKMFDVFFFSPPCAKGVLQTTACPDSRTNISVYYCDDPPHKDFNDPNSLVTEHHPPPPNPGGPATSEPDTEKKPKKKPHM